MQKKSSAILQFIVLYSENGQQDPLFITNYAIINVLDAISGTPGVGQATLFAKMNYSMRIWFDTQRLTSLNLAPSDVIAAIRTQSVQAPVGRIGARPIQRRPAIPVQRADAGTALDGGAVRQYRAARQSRRLDAAHSRTSPGSRSARRTSTAKSRIDGRAGRADRHLSRAGRQCGDDGERGRSRRWRRLSKRFPDGTEISRAIRFDDLRARHDRGGAADPWRSLRPGRDRRLSVPRQSARHDHSGCCRTGQPDRRVRGAAVLGYSANTVSLLAMVLAIGIVVDDAIVVVENVERVMEEDPELSPAEATQEGDGADHGADHRDLAGAALGVCADRLHSRHFRHAVPAIRGDDQRRDGDLGTERADACRRRFARCSCVTPAAGAALWAAFSAALIGCATVMPAACGGWCACQ